VDLTALLLRVAARRPHVLVVAVPGATCVRLAFEAALARRGWPIATGPADADVLAVAGVPGPELAAVVDAVWEQVPAPRARIEVPAPADVDDRLDAAAALLADAEHQRTEAMSGNEGHSARAHSRPPHGDHAGHAEHGGHSEHAGHVEQAQHAGHSEHGGDADHGDHAEHADHSAHGGHGEHGGHAEHSDHGGSREHHDHAGHGGEQAQHAGHAEHGAEAAGDHAAHGGGHHGHDGHGGMVAGLPMADLGPDRDGLTLDRLHVPLGPLLPDWPAGLVVRVTLQGDVIQEASADVLDAGHAVPFEWPSAVARELDGLARFLGVAGWPSAAGQARRLRDASLSGDSIEAATAALLGRIRRSRTLRWLLRGIPAGSTGVAELLATRLAALETALGADQRAGTPPEPQHAVGLAGLADVLVGAELAAARLIVAALDPDTERVGVRHG
jgi:hypothetical protein